ncbi:pectinesterase qrt1 [Phtheirospermum japonicum]|uniref:Pectinesterase n=1 Tax=Phtheirospermum japonicum TaxID=374723 RepID=A0A830D3E2_9LAMI|nr:pectinesterase qrt1 [Phtheirospermum japonicum]
MNFSILFIIFSLVLVELWAEVQPGGAYITWDDLTVSSGNDEKRVIVVNPNGGGDSTTVQGAVDMVPDNNADRVKIHILPGLYSEKVRIPASKPYISLIGDPNQASATVITWHDKASDKGNDGSELGTENSATVAVESDYFCASWITFQLLMKQNAAVGGGQAVALRTAGDKNVFYESRFLGSQDTLLDEYGTHFFFRCFIQGSVDFIFGFATSLYRECTISVLASPYAITAHGRVSANDNTGYSFVNCTVTGNGPVYLGRAWGDYSRVIYSYSEFDVDIFPQGWSDWGVSSKDNTVVFGEYECKGRGADRSGRVGYSKELSDSEANPYLGESFISGELWLGI